MPTYDVLIYGRRHRIDDHLEVSPGVQDTMTTFDRIRWLCDNWQSVSLTKFQRTQLDQITMKYLRKTSDELTAQDAVLIKELYTTKYRGRHTLGDIVEIQEGPWWGDGTDAAIDGRPTRGWPKGFFRLRVTDAPIDIRYLSTPLGEDTGEVTSGGTAIMRNLYRRNYYIDPKSVPVEIRSRFAAFETVTVTWDQIRPYISAKG